MVDQAAPTLRAIRDGAREYATSGVVQSTPASARASRITEVASDIVAGIIAAVVVLSYCVSYSSLLFPGLLQGGLQMGLWSLLIGSIVAGTIVGCSTSIPPISAGPDTPVIAMLSVLSAAVAANVFAAGGTPDLAVRHVLLAFTLATAVTGACLLTLGWTGSAKYIRFVPYPVAAGFIGASGLLMVHGSIKLMFGQFELGSWSDLVAGMTSGHSPKLITALSIAALLILVRRFIVSSIATPAILFLAVLGLDILLWKTDLLGDAAAWFSGGMRAAVAWSPLKAGLSDGTDWSLLRDSVPAILASAGIMVISLLVKISNMEVARSAAADLDREFVAHGAANLACAAVGGVGGGLVTNASRVLEEAGGKSRASGLFCAVVIAIVVMTRIDLTEWVPTPVLSGLLIFLGCTLLLDTFGRPSAQISRIEIALTVMIFLICLRFGYPTGVLVGFVASCVLFVFRYSRIGVMRRHSTRAYLTTAVERPPEEAIFLRDTGDRIHVYWLSGYLFFGSSDALFDRVRATVETQTLRPVEYIVLDFAGVTGIDTSALKSLAKMTSYCNRRGITIVYTGLCEQHRASLVRGRYVGTGTPHVVLPSRLEALEWCDERLLAKAHGTLGGNAAERFEDWLVANLEHCDPKLVLAYFQRREVAKGAILYRQGAPSDTIDLVASGFIAITIDEEDGRKLRLRRMVRKTVVGEMGFFRGTPRTANVEAEEDAVLYTLTRASYERMLREQPQLAAAFLQFIIRVLADRIEFANREIAALT